MLQTLLPGQIDNTYHGRKLALWLFAAVVFTKTAMSLNSIFLGHMVAGSADGLPLDTYTPAGAQAVIALFAIWGLAQLVICLLCALVLARYRAFVPFMFAVLLLEHLSRKLVLYFLPMSTAGSSPGSAVNLVLLTLMVLGLALALVPRTIPHMQSRA